MLSTTERCFLAIVEPGIYNLMVRILIGYQILQIFGIRSRILFLYSGSIDIHILYFRPVVACAETGYGSEAGSYDEYIFHFIFHNSFLY